MAGFGGGVQGVGGYVARAVAEVQQAQGTAGPGVPGFVDGAGGVGGDGGFVGSFDDLRLRAGSCGAGVCGSGLAREGLAWGLAQMPVNRKSQAAMMVFRSPPRERSSSPNVVRETPASSAVDNTTG